MAFGAPLFVGGCKDAVAAAAAAAAVAAATCSAGVSVECASALSLADKVTDADFRGGLDSLIRFQAASDLLGKGEVDSALRYAQGVSDVRQRAFMFAGIGRALLDKKDVARASGVLADAEKTIGKAKDGTDKAQAMLLITEVKVRLDPVQGFAAMEGSSRLSTMRTPPTARPASRPPAAR